MASLELTKDGTYLGDPARAEDGDEVSYAFTVTNTGNVSLTAVAISDSLGFTVTCDATTLAPGAVTDCAGSYFIDQTDIDAGVVNNTATASASGPQGPARRRHRRRHRPAAAGGQPRADQGRHLSG